MKTKIGNLTPSEKAEVHALSKTLERSKVSLADLTLQYESQRNALLQAVAQSQQSLLERLNVIGKAHGIDPNNPTVRWNFDTDKMVFVRQL